MAGAQSRVRFLGYWEGGFAVLGAPPGKPAGSNAAYVRLGRERTIRMANDVTKSPLILDTVSAGDLLTASAPIRITAIAWVPGASAVAGDAVSLTDSSGREIFSATAIGANNPPRVDAIFAGALDVQGLKLPTLAH